MPAECVRWGEKTEQVCAQYRDDGYNACGRYRDDGYNACGQYQDQGYNACRDWRGNCCDWWPCSWACEVVSWVCVAWYWVSSWVCVAWYWVSSWVCVAWYWVSNVVCAGWAWVTKAVCLLWISFNTVVGAVVEAVESIIGYVLSTFAWFVDLVLSIPIIGRLIKLIWNGVLTVIWGVVGLVDVIVYLIGIRPEKKLRVCTIVLCDENSTPVDADADVLKILNTAITVFKSEANVRIVRDGPFQFTSEFAAASVADTSWIHRYCPQGGGDPKMLDTFSDARGHADTLWLFGSRLQFILDTECYYTTFRRLIGYGAPIILVIVRRVISDGGADKAGFGSPLLDYVLIARAAGGRRDDVAAHEFGHACNLWHTNGDDNLMNPQRTTGSRLSLWQAVMVRNSRHVTYF